MGSAERWALWVAVDILESPERLFAGEYVQVEALVEVEGSTSDSVCLTKARAAHVRHGQEVVESKEHSESPAEGDEQDTQVSSLAFGFLFRSLDAADAPKVC